MESKTMSMSMMVATTGLFPNEIKWLIDIHTTETKMNNDLCSEVRHLIALGLIQRISGTNTYELTEFGKEYLKAAGLLDVLNLAKEQKSAVVSMLGKHRK